MSAAPETDPLFTAWLSALESRHLADLRVPEVTRALRALSSAYVERRHRIAGRGTLDTDGKRAAFALFYSPLHYLTTTYVLSALGVTRAPTSIVDIGCGTGTAGAAWAVAAGGRPSVQGVDRHPWAVDEARWTYRQFGLDGRARLGDLTRLPPLSRADAIVAAYVLNELDASPRRHLEDALIRAAQHGARVLVLEPIARGVVPWWDETAAKVVAAGGRADEWRFRVELPPLLALFDRAAGLHHQELTARSLWMGPASPLVR